MPLKLTLKPAEQFIVNGAVLTNGSTKTTLTVENAAVILRNRDILQEDDANTPAKRIYFCVQLAYLDSENSDQYLHKVNRLLGEFVAAVPSAEVTEIVVPLGAELAAGQYFKALKRCKRLIAFEETRLKNDFESV